MDTFGLAVVALGMLALKGVVSFAIAYAG